MSTTQQTDEEKHYHNILALLKDNINKEPVHFAHLDSETYTSEDELVLYMDKHIESIAEALMNVTIDDLKFQLGYYGQWSLRHFGDVYILATSDTNVDYESIK